MSSIVINGDSSGSVTLTVPSAAGTNTATLPASTGTVMVSGNMPAFSAYASGNQSLTSGSYSKLQFQVKEFDTASAFDNTTNYRFQPTIAGYYQFVGCMNIAATTGVAIISFYKNGSEFKRGSQIAFSGSTVQPNSSALIYLNGSTDYVECYGFQNSGLSQSTNSGSSQVYFQAFMVRTA